ncbi:MGMT family protein [Gordonibacter sp. 28C]|uniref:MGMT family protein n=1 Tax=Gordonibacter sp. 28C TaxID=2078569 RepID=UPI001F542539|nr:MGMT family protein [Gordonibacter sp. 28C]
MPQKEPGLFWGIGTGEGVVAVQDAAAAGSGMIEMDDLFFERVYEQVRRVPAGSVCTYGTIAELAGYPKASREVGLAMSRVQRGWDLPCHRIVNAKGTLAPTYAFGGKRVQRRLLEDEGVAFADDETIDMARHRWPPLETSGGPEQLALPLG